jgi:hypothetical protein
MVRLTFFKVEGGMPAASIVPYFGYFSYQRSLTQNLCCCDWLSGFVQGSLIPWIVLELIMGTSSFDVTWMPMIHLGVFFSVVFIYDWLKDEHHNSKNAKDADWDEDSDDEPNVLV